MRVYGKVMPGFWTGETGRLIRACGRDAVVIAAYAITGPMANSLGLYYVPLPTLCHETGTTLEEARGALKRLAEIDFCFYDENQEHLWVPAMAKYQIAVSLSPFDKRIKWVRTEIMKYNKSKFFNDFIKRYCDAFCLGQEFRTTSRIDYDKATTEGPPKGLRRASEGSPKPLILYLISHISYLIS